MSFILHAQCDVFRTALRKDWIGNHFKSAPKHRDKASPEANYKAALDFVSRRFRNIADKAGRLEQDVSIYEVTAVDSSNAQVAIAAIEQSVVLPVVVQ